MAEIRGRTFDDVFEKLIADLSRAPDYVCSPRDLKIKECLAKTLVLEDPRSRLILNRKREANYGFAVGEFLWYWQGRNDLESIVYYNKRMSAYSDDGKTLNSAYGYRLRQERNLGITQWEAIRRTLCSDPDSRRALMLINQPIDEAQAATTGSSDVPCTVSLQFFIRGRKLHLHVLMRSNDVIWGLTNDLFSFTLFQECMLLDLKKEKQFEDLELGTYYHTAGSLHLYERHFGLAEDILAEYRQGVTPAPMDPLTSLEDLATLCEGEEALRTRKTEKINETRQAGGFRWMARCLNGHRERRDAERVQLL